MRDEARHLKRSLAKVWPDEVTFTTIDSGDVMTWRPPLTLGVLQANSCKLVQVLQAWLSAKVGRAAGADVRGLTGNGRFGSQKAQLLQEPLDNYHH